MTLNDSVKRVAVLRNQFLPYSETFIHDELRHHARYLPTVLARQVHNAERFSGHEVVAITTKERAAPRASLWYGLAGRSRVFDKALKAREYALLHAHFLHNGAYALAFAERHRLPLVVSVHGHDVTVLLGRERFTPKWWFLLPRYRRLFASATLFLTASRELADLLVSIGCPASKLRVCRLGVDLESCAAKGGPAAGVPRIVMVGRFVEKKGHLYGIDAVARLRAAGHEATLVIVGSGPLQPEYDRRIEQLGLRPFVRFTGPLEHAAVLREIARATVLLAPSVVAGNLDRESGMIAAKEASALGVPVVGTLHGGLPEIVDDGVTGYLVPERDAAALANRLANLLEDGEKRRQFGEAAHRKMLELYDIRRCVGALEEHYDEAVRLYRTERAAG